MWQALTHLDLLTGVLLPILPFVKLLEKNSHSIELFQQFNLQSTDYYGTL